MNASGFRLGRGAMIGLAVACALGGAALAEEPTTSGDPANAMAGTWEFSNADHDKICRFTFRAGTVAGGYRLDVDRNCANLFPSTKDVVGWTLDTFGSLRLLDARGNPIIELTAAEDGIFDGFQPGEGRYVLQSAAAAPVHTAEDMVGDWVIARGTTGKPICVLTLANNPAGANNPASAENLSLKVKPGCDVFVTRFGPTAWRIDRGDLVLLSARGLTWRFEENEPNIWSRVPEGADHVTLVRQ
jgi:Protease inhibitor Inh